MLAEGLEPHTVEQVYRATTNTPTHWIDIGATIDKKIAAMLEHRRQVSDLDRLAEFLRRRAADDSRLPGLAYVEAFPIIDASGG